MLKVLWSVNTLPPVVAEKIGTTSFHAISWVVAMSEYLSSQLDFCLTIVSPGGRGIKKIIEKNICNINYIVLPYDCRTKNYWKKIISVVNPDIIHIYGTEDRHNLSLISEYKREFPIMISLQGIISEYVKYYYAGMTNRDIVKSLTVGDIILNRSIFSGKKKFVSQAKVEQLMLRQVSFVEGRSDWDKAYSMKYNSNLHYYYCPRMIRKEFFVHRWTHAAYEEHSILVHQAAYPIKGLHFVLDALSILRIKYPDIKLYICGNVDFHPSTIKGKLLFTGYTKFIYHRIEELNLWRNIVFTGYLNAKEMAALLSRVQVCVVPSSIENAPNALAESMVVGTPCISSYVGGSPDMLNYGECGLLYRYDEPEMLAARISDYFNDESLLSEKAERAYQVARERHSDVNTGVRLLSIYRDVIDVFNRA